MPQRPTILIIGNFNRTDYIDLFAACKQHFDFYFLEFASKDEVSNNYYQTYGRAIFWGDFKDADNLLAIINPHKVVFFFIESYYHVLLNMVCKSKGIPTYVLDHGLRDVSISSRIEKYLIERKSPVASKSRFKKLKQFTSRLKTRLFLLQSKKKLSKPEATFFKAYMDIRKNRTLWETFSEIKSPFRLPSAYIAFSPKTYEAHAYHDQPAADQLRYFIGIPTFDHLAYIKPIVPNPHQAIFFDQGFACQEILGWDYATYKAFIKAFAHNCQQYNIHIHVKLHPLQNSRDENLWTDYSNVSLIDDRQVTKLLPECRLVFGFNSTYLLPMMALQHITVVVFENHPAGKVDAFKSFIDAGVAYPVYNIEEFQKILSNITEIHKQQLPNKASFTAEWMYKFDGKSGERLRDILLSNTP
ncbi:polysialyltransferase family glycosyltransferase [Pontibacter cellulosilyticus]|uniref:Uncharacterized protein n=1 Tax=Pontibacter cellulosilyticus TaxID=1720253 RepID=A0A923N898_9BACT|nr:polysialyltransferase family glycosyltransferase [Pontibacter cellulosilyticus]MBC5993612.1 hypothetical protein [Pontibacter cellulosilyticus]